MKKPDYQAVSEYARQRLKNELSPRLVYHSLAHTERDVLAAAERFAAYEGVQGEELLLLRTAVWFHDIGYVVQRANHEMISVDIAAAVLCDFGYSNEQIAVIGDIILATRLPQTPHTLLEQIIADADLDSLGREDFMERGENLRAEMAAFGTEVDDEEWLHEQIYFLEQHIYFTRAARHLRSAGKQRNIRALQAMLAKR